MTVHAASIESGRFACVLDEKLSMEQSYSRYGDECEINPVLGMGTVSLVSDYGYWTKQLLRGTGSHVLKVRGGVALTVVCDAPHGDFVQSTVRMDKLALAIVPHAKADNSVLIASTGGGPSTLSGHRHIAGIAVLRAINDAWFPYPPKTPLLPAPQPAKTARSFFIDEKRPSLDGKSLTQRGLINMELEAVWRRLPDAAQAPYHKQARDDAARHSREMAAYEAQRLAAAAT